MRPLLLLTLLPLLATDTPDLFSGNGGWAGAGLLGLVLAWLLLKHLPDKDRLIAQLLADNRAENKVERDQHASDLKAERELCQQGQTRLAELLNANTVETGRLSQETRMLSASVGNLAIAVGVKPKP